MELYIFTVLLSFQMVSVLYLLRPFGEVLFLFASKQAFFLWFPIQSSKSRNGTSERMWDLSIHTYIKKSKQTLKLKQIEGQWLLSWKHFSFCLIEAVLHHSVHLGYWPSISQSEAQFQVDQNFRVYICLILLILPLLLGQHKSMLLDIWKQAVIAFCSSKKKFLFLTNIHSKGILLYFIVISSSGSIILVNTVVPSIDTCHVNIVRKLLSW